MARLIPEKESLTVEFKSDRKRLPDRDLIEAAVCLANTDGGDIYLGVEKDGAPTGLHAEHRNITGLCQINENQASHLLRKLYKSGKLKLIGSGRIERDALYQFSNFFDWNIKGCRLEKFYYIAFLKNVPLTPMYYRSKIWELRRICLKLSRRKYESPTFSKGTLEAWKHGVKP